MEIDHLSLNVAKAMSGEYYIEEIETWTLWKTIGATSVVLAFYLLLVLNILPHYMRNKEAFQLKNFLLYYNAFQVAFSFCITSLYLRYLLIHGLFTSKCADKQSMETIIKGIYPYFIAKHVDLLDTVFFVLRQKDSQITFLHLYHHSAMVMWTWLHLMHHPTDHFIFVGLLNSFVHVLMYTYYGISSMGPDYAKYVWWKKHLTKIQLIQFILVVSHLYYQQKLSPCPIPAYFHFYCLFCIISFFFLFMKFYFSSYKPRQKAVKDCVEKETNIDQEDLLKSD